MSKPVTKKRLFVCLAISLVIIIAGAFLFGFLGFNTDSTTKSYEMIEVSDYISSFRDEEVTGASGQSLTDFCRSEIEKAGFSVSDERETDSTALGNTVEFIISGSTAQQIQEFVPTLQERIGQEFQEYGDSAIVTVSYHSVQNQPYYEFIWRTAIGAGVAFVLLFAYVAIRFKVGMGVTALIAAVHDVLLTLAVVALLRIPAGVTLIGVAAFSLLLSAILNLIVFGKMRRDFRSEERKGLPAREGIALSVKDSVKSVLIVCIMLAALTVCLGAVGAFIGFDLLSVMLSTLMAIVRPSSSHPPFTPASRSVRMRFARRRRSTTTLPKRPRKRRQRQPKNRLPPNLPTKRTIFTAGGGFPPERAGNVPAFCFIGVCGALRAALAAEAAFKFSPAYGLQIFMAEIGR